jgi:hypothetical protein
MILILLRNSIFFKIYNRNIIKSRTSTWSLDDFILKKYLSLFLRRVDLKLNHIFKVSFVATSNIQKSQFFRSSRMHIILIGCCNEQSFNAWVCAIELRYPNRLTLCIFVSQLFDPWVFSFIKAARCSQKLSQSSSTFFLKSENVIKSFF